MCVRVGGGGGGGLGRGMRELEVLVIWYAVFLV